MLFLPGQVVRINGLKSAEGKWMNKKRAVVIRLVDGSDPPRYEVIVEESTTVDRPNATSAIKATNLNINPQLPLPPSESSQQRGYVTMPDERMFRTLTELLVRPTPNYRPSEITVFVGYASTAFQRLGQFNYRMCNNYQLEQIGGIAAIANTCEQGGVCACEGAMFALLEGDSMCLDVCCLLLGNTPFIGPEEQIPEVQNDFYATPEDQLTPDQETEAYITYMSQGLLLLFNNMIQWKFSSALFAAIRRTQFYPLALQRIVRIIGREGMPNPTRDGQKLGKSCRKLLPHFVGLDVVTPEIVEILKSKVSQSVAARLLTPMTPLEMQESILNLWA